MNADQERLRAAYITGWRQFGDALEAYPELCLPTGPTLVIPVGDDQREQLEMWKHVMGEVVESVFEGSNGVAYLETHGSFAGFRVKVLTHLSVLVPPDAAEVSS